MNLTENEAERALRSLSVMRAELRDYTVFRDELEIIHLEGRCYAGRGAKVIIEKNENRTLSLNMPYDYLMKWILAKIELLQFQIAEIETKFKIEE